MEVKIIRLPGTTTTVEIPEGGTVAEALNAADIQLSRGEAVKMNSLPCDSSDTCSEGARIVIAQGAKGN